MKKASTPLLVTLAAIVIYGTVSILSNNSALTLKPSSKPTTIKRDFSTMTLNELAAVDPKNLLPEEKDDYNKRAVEVAKEEVVKAQRESNNPTNPPTISKEEFDQLQDGMTYEQVTKIIGGPGELFTEAGIQHPLVAYNYKG